MKEKVVTKHIDAILSKNNVEDIFRDLRVKSGGNNVESAESYVDFKFKKAQLDQ